MAEVTPQELADWALEINNALRNDSKTIEFSEARRAVMGITEAFRQCVFELFMIFDMTPDDWFSDPSRRHWAEQIRLAHMEWSKDKH